MEQFGTSGTSSRFTKYRTLLVALGVIFVGGAVFAATNTGSTALKNLFVFISIDGEVTELELEAIDGDAVWVMENEDGGTTTVNLYDVQIPDGESVQTVDVVIDADGGGDKVVDVLLGGMPSTGTIFITDGGALAAHAGGGCGVFVTEEQNGDGGENVTVIEIIGDAGDGHEQRQKLIDELLSEEADGAVNVEVELGEDGIAAITLTYEDGTERVLTLDVNDAGEDGELTDTVDDDGNPWVQKPAAESDE